MEEQPLPPEVVDRLRQQILEAYPEMEGAEMRILPFQPAPQEAAVAEKLGLPAPKEPPEPRYVVTLRREIQAEDGITIPLVVRITVNAEGEIIKESQAR